MRALLRILLLWQSPGLAPGDSTDSSDFPRQSGRLPRHLHAGLLYDRWGGSLARDLRFIYPEWCTYPQMRLAKFASLPRLRG